MRFYNRQHTYYCGIDLHVKTMYVCILDGAGQVLVYDYVARHIIVVMCPRLICGGARSSERSAPVGRGKPDT